MEIRKKVFITEQNVPVELEIDEFEKTSTHFLALVDGIPSGVGRLRLKHSYVKFERIATLTTLRGAGVGRKLTTYMLEFARKAFPTYLPAMHAQESAIGFYKKLGWIEVGEKFLEAGIVHQVLIFPPDEEATRKKLKAHQDPHCREDIKAILKK